MYEYHNYKFKVGKYGKYVSLLRKNNEKIINLGLDKAIQEKFNIKNLNENVLNKLFIIYSNKKMNQNLNKDILKMLEIKTETETEIEIEKEELKFINHV